MDAVRKHSEIKIHIIFHSMILMAFIICYSDVLYWMYVRYTGVDSYYSHGFLIPALSSFLIWRKRNKLKDRKISACWWGLALVALSLFVHIIGTFLYLFSISGFSILLLIIGVCLFTFGKEITRTIIFPLLLVIFMIPVPMAIIEIFSFPLKLFVTRLGAELIGLIGIPILREGFLISIPSGDLVVDNPCSGLRSLMAFLTLGAVVAYLEDISLTRKFCLFLMVIPLAIISNVVRLLILILIGHFWGINAAAPESIWHMGTGIFIFVATFMLMFLLARTFNGKS